MEGSENASFLMLVCGLIILMSFVEVNTFNVVVGGDYFIFG